MIKRIEHLLLIVVLLASLHMPSQASPPVSSAQIDNGALLPGLWHGLYTNNSSTYHLWLMAEEQNGEFFADGYAWLALTETQAIAAAKQELREEDILDPRAFCVHLRYKIVFDGRRVTFAPISDESVFEKSNPLAQTLRPFLLAATFSGVMQPSGFFGGRVGGIQKMEENSGGSMRMEFKMDSSSGRMTYRVFGDPGLFRFWKDGALDHAKSLTLSRGQTHSLSCLDGGAYHYTCYLPHSYSPSRPAPVLIYMAPRGNAAPLSPKMAERLGWIMIGLTEARDGPLKPICENYTAVIFDARRRFNISPNRWYFAGFSGGARASIVAGANFPDECAGILCIGAAIMQGAAPARRVPIYYMAGETDYNRRETVEEYGAQQARGRVTTFRLHSGGHSMGHAPDHEAAIAWLAKASRSATKR